MQSILSRLFKFKFFQSLVALVCIFSLIEATPQFLPRLNNFIIISESEAQFVQAVKKFDYPRIASLSKVTNVNIPLLFSHDRSSALCYLATKCQHNEHNEDALKTAMMLMQSGADPSISCRAKDQVAFIHELVLRRCSRLLKRLLKQEPVPNPIDVNHKWYSQYSGTALHLAAQNHSPITISTDEQDTFATLDILLKHPSVDVNARSSLNTSATQEWCFALRRHPNMLLAFQVHVLQKFWMRESLDEEQRELILNHCGSSRDLVLDRFEHDYWEVTLSKDYQLGSVKSAEETLKVVHDSSKNSTLVKLPMKIRGLKGQDDGGVVASVFEQMSASVFSFGFHQYSSSNNIAEHVRIWVNVDSFDEKLDISQAFAPAPSSLILFEDQTSIASIRVKVKERLKLAGTLIGVCMNTLFFSKSLSLGLPLDEIVLQRLIDPTSMLNPSDSLNCAVCIHASEMLHSYGLSLSEARESFPGVWPEIEFTRIHPHSTNDTQAEWDDYCVALVDRLLSKQHSPAFASMLEGFEATIPKGQKTHYFTASLAHRMLVGISHVTMEMLVPRIHFESQNAPDQRLNEEFLEVLRELSVADSENLNRFLKEVTGSSCLRQGAYAPFITIYWVTPEATGNKYKALTCTSTLYLPMLADKELLRATLSYIVGPRTDVFNTA